MIRAYPGARPVTILARRIMIEQLRRREALDGATKALRHLVPQWNHLSEKEAIQVLTQSEWYAYRGWARSGDKKDREAYRALWWCFHPTTYR